MDLFVNWRPVESSSPSGDPGICLVCYNLSGGPSGSCGFDAWLFWWVVWVWWPQWVWWVSCVLFMSLRSPLSLIGLVGLMSQPWVFLEFSGFVRGDPKLFQNESIDFCQKVSPGLTTGLCLRAG